MQLGWHHTLLQALAPGGSSISGLSGVNGGTAPQKHYAPYRSAAVDGLRNGDVRLGGGLRRAARGSCIRLAWKPTFCERALAAEKVSL